MRPFQIKYKIVSEIRHGSPYNLVELETIGECKIIIARNNNWQDKHAWTTNGKFFAQVKWDLEKNEPGFKVVLFDSEKGEIMQTKRISGCCNKLKLTNDLDIEYETFTIKLMSDNKKEYCTIKGQVKTGYNTAYKAFAG